MMYPTNNKRRESNAEERQVDSDIEYDLDKLYIVPALRAYIDDCQTLGL